MTQTLTAPQSSSPASEPSKTPWWEFFTFSVDHKVIGIQYLVTSFTFYLIGGALASAVRVELATPDPDLVDPAFYNSLFTMHGTVMIFLWLISLSMTQKSTFGAWSYLPQSASLHSLPLPLSILRIESSTNRPRLL